MKLDYLQQFWEFVKRKPEKVALEDHLEPLDDWYLLPCRIGNQQFLTKIGERRTVFNLATEIPMAKVLGRLPIRQATFDWCPAESFFATNTIKSFYSSAISNVAYSNARFILSALLECGDKGRSKLVEWNFQIFDFFQSAICNNGNGIVSIEDFLSLPIFKHFDGGYRPVLDG